MYPAIRIFEDDSPARAESHQLPGRGDELDA
jgi:hypothetical protein